MEKTPLFDFVLSLSRAVDLVSPVIADHHIRTAYIAGRIAAQAGVAPGMLSDLVIAAMLHDIGAFSLGEKLSAMNFEIAEPYNHALTGSRLLCGFPPFERPADIIRHHHFDWTGGAPCSCCGKEISAESNILYLADRIAVSIIPGEHVLLQTGRIRATVDSLRRSRFRPEIVDAFLAVSERESFWLAALDAGKDTAAVKAFVGGEIVLDTAMLMRLSMVFSHIIDYRSRFTATHSSGVAAVSEALFRRMGMEDEQCALIRIAGYLHDLGKLSVPTEILEKRDSLTAAEHAVIRAHTYYTAYVLRGVAGFDDIALWASAHHETLDGKGYPFRLNAGSMPSGARVVAIADIFTALMEDRPYRTGMSGESALGIIGAMAKEGKADAEIAGLLRSDFTDIDGIRRESQDAAREEYRIFREGR